MTKWGWRATGMAALVAGAVLTSACIVKETDTTITIEPDGSGTWTIVDRDVRSQADSSGERLRDEQGFLEEIESGRYGPAMALRDIGCADVSADMARRSWPYTIVTEGRFSDVGAVWQQFLDRAGLRGQSWIETSGDRVTWRMWVDAREDTQSGATERDDSVDVLLSGSAPRWFLRHGRFLEATGFELGHDGRLATMKALVGDDRDKTEDVVVLSLTWRADAATPSGGAR